MNFTVTKGTDADFPAVLSLIKGLAEFEKQPDAVINTVEQMKRDRDLFDLYVARVNGKVVGMSLYYFTYSTWVGKSLYLEDLYVLPEYRRNGIGQALLEKTVSTAASESCNRMRWQVLDWNTKAQKLYKRLGAEISTEWYNCDLSRDELKLKR